MDPINVGELHPQSAYCLTLENLRALYAKTKGLIKDCGMRVFSDTGEFRVVFVPIKYHHRYEIEYVRSEPGEDLEDRVALRMKQLGVSEDTLRTRKHGWGREIAVQETLR